MPKSKPELPPGTRAYCEFMSGAAVGMLEVICLNPLDVIKSRLQVQGLIPVPRRDHYSGVFNAMVKIYYREGLFAFWRGLGSPLLMDPPKRGLNFVLYGQLMPLVQFGSQPTPLTHATAGAVSGILESFLMNPFEVVKITQQVHQKQYLWTLNIFRYIIRRYGYGIEGLYRGITALIARNVIIQFTYLGIYYVMMDWFPDARRPSSNLLRNLSIAGFSAAVACTLGITFDMAKCRIQGPQPVRGVVKYRWTIQTVRTVYREEGLRAFFRGLAPMLMRTIPGGAIEILSFEAFVDFCIKRYRYDAS